MAGIRILVLVGSLRNASINRQLAKAVVQLAPSNVETLVYHGLADIPYFNEDIDTADTIPGPARELREAVSASDALLLFTPEYNGTLPAVLKNAIDWASRPYGRGAIFGKPVAIISASVGRNGGKLAYADAVKAVGIAGGRVVDLEHPNLGGIAEDFEAQGQDQQVCDALTEAIAALVAAVGR